MGNDTIQMETHVSVQVFHVAVSSYAYDLNFKKRPFWCSSLASFIRVISIHKQDKYNHALEWQNQHKDSLYADYKAPYNHPKGDRALDQALIAQQTLLYPTSRSINS